MKGICKFCGRKYLNIALHQSIMKKLHGKEKVKALIELINANPHMIDAWNMVEKYRKEHGGKLPTWKI